jgi:hypothetical protein
LRKVICSIFALISYSHDMCKILFWISFKNLSRVILGCTLC